MAGSVKGINLNILECKSKFVNFFKFLSNSINLNILECKCKTLLISKLPITY